MNMQFVDNTIYTGPQDENVYSEIDNNLLKYLLSDYMFISYHDLKKGIVTYRDLNNPDNELVRDMLEQNNSIFEWYTKVVNKYVYKDDRDELLEILNPDNHGKLLKDVKSRYMYYRWNTSGEEYKYYKMVISKLENENEDAEHVIVGSLCVDEEVRSKFESEKEKERQMALFDGLSSEFNIIWFIRPDRSVELIRCFDDEHTKEIIETAARTGADYDRGVQIYSDMFVAPDDVDRFEEALRYDKLNERVPKKGFYTTTFKRIGEHGTLFYLQICISRAQGSAGECNYIVATREVDEMIRGELKRQEEYQKAMKERDIDGLTGIHNRFLFDNKIKTYHNSIHDTIGCIYIDVDGLHELNSLRGHAEGDELIKCVGLNVLKYWGKEDTFRIGGDEFVAFCFDKNEEELKADIERFRERIVKSGYSTSIGWSIRNIKALNITELLREAEDAMYEEKKAHYTGDNDRRKR